MRTIILFFCVLFLQLNLVEGQTWKLPFEGKVEKDGGNCSGAEINLIKNGKQAEQKITGTDGKFKFLLEPDNDYKIEITKPGCIKKFFTCTTRGVPGGSHSDFQIELSAVVLFEPPSGCDLSALNKPLLSFAYDTDTKNFEFDKRQYESSLDALEKIAECEEMAKIITKKFQKLIQEAQKAMAKKDCKAAGEKYNEALKLRPFSEEAKTGKKDADNLCLNGEKTEEDYLAAMTAGNTAMDSKNYEKALAEFQKASTLKPGEKEPPKKIEEVNILMKKLGSEKEFEEVMKQGNEAMSAKDYSKALELFNKAKLLNPSHPDPPKKITEINSINDKQKKYDNAMSKGNAQQNQKNWDAAISAYEEALSIFPNDATAKAKKDECVLEKNKLSAAEDLQKKYEEAMKNGQIALSGKKWDEAIQQFNAALTLRKEDTQAKAKIKEAEDAKKSFEENSKSEAAFNAAMEKGNNAMKTKNWASAISSFQEALNIKKENQQAKLKLQEANDALAKENELSASEAKFKEAMQLGNDAMNTKNWTSAIQHFNSALTIKPNETVAKTKIEEAKSALEKANASASLEQKFNEALQKGNDALIAKKWDDAIAHYSTALGLKKEDITAKTKKAEAEEGKRKELASAKSEELFQAAMKKGEKELTNSNYSVATTLFEEALKIKPQDESAKKKLAEAIAALEKEKNTKETDKKFQEAMKKGNDALSSKNYTVAISAFTEAAELKPDDINAPLRKKEAENALKNESEKNANEKMFSEWMSKGNQSMANLEFKNAIDNFTNALSIKKEDATANAKLKEAKEKFAQTEKNIAQELQFNECIKKGSEEMTAANYSAAKNQFLQALSIKKDDVTAKTKLAEAEAKLKELNDKKDNQEAYDQAISKATESEKKLNWKEAISHYKEALKKKPEDALAIAKIKTAENELKRLEEQERINQDYISSMEKGQNLLDGASYAEAIESFSKALSIKANDVNATKKKAEAESLLKSFQEKQAKLNTLLVSAQAAFNKSDWSNALDYYKKIKEIESKHPEAKIKIPLCEEKLLELKLQEEANKELEKNYAESIKQGADLYGKNLLEEALKKYMKAEEIKPAEQEPKLKIKEIREKINRLKIEEEEAKKLEADYTEAMKEGNRLMNENKLDVALEKFVFAQKLKPAETEPAIKIKQIETRLEQEKAAKKLEEDFYSAMKEGNNAMMGENWNEAIAVYRNKALKLKPGNAEALVKINEAEIALKSKRTADSLLKIENEKTAQYNQIISEARGFFNAKEYKKALASYAAARDIKSHEPEPIKKIDELNALIKQMEEDEKIKENQLKIDAEYNNAMIKGNQAVKEKQFETALTQFKHAQRLKPSEPQPQKEIEATELILKKLQEVADQEALDKEMERKYQSAMKAGETGITTKDWISAKTKFEEALSIKNNDPAAKQKLNFVLSKIEEQKGKDSDLLYKNAMAKGDNSIKTKNYNEALKNFKEALNAKPGDATAKQKITETEKLIGSVTNTPEKEISEKEKLYGNYPEGVTNETFNKGNCYTVRSVVKKGNNIVVYEKRHYNWGGTFFFRDGSEISGSAYEQGINE